MWCPKELWQYERNIAPSRIIFYCHAIAVKCNLWFKLLIHVQCAYCDIINLQKNLNRDRKRESVAEFSCGVVTHNSHVYSISWKWH